MTTDTERKSSVVYELATKWGVTVLDMPLATGITPKDIRGLPAPCEQKPDTE